MFKNPKVSSFSVLLILSPEFFLSLCSSSSLASQLINFLFCLLSPVSSILLFLHSHFVPFLPLLFSSLFLSRVFLSFSATHPYRVPIFLFSLSRSPAHTIKSRFVFIQCTHYSCLCNPKLNSAIFPHLPLR